MTAPRLVSGRAPADSGFTLMEMLIGVAMLSLIMALLTGTLGSARIALGFVERTTAVTPVYSAQSYLRSALIQARAKQRGSNSNDNDPGFIGNAEWMQFITSYSPQGQMGGLYRLQIVLQPSAKGQFYNLVVLQTFARAAPSDAPPPELPVARAILIESVQAISFSYYGAVDDSSAPEWQDSWSLSYKLPTLVSIDLKFAPGDGRIWPRLIVPVVGSDTSAVPCPPRVSCL